MSSSSSSSTTDLKKKLVHVINESSLQSNQKASAMLSLKDELLNASTLEDWMAYESKENLPKLLRELFNQAAGIKEVNKPEPTSTMQVGEGSQLQRPGNIYIGNDPSSSSSSTSEPMIMTANLPGDTSTLLSTHQIISLCIENKPKDAKQIANVEGFMFLGDYQPRPVAEKILIDGVKSNHISFKRKSRQNQSWSYSSVLGGSGIGKSGFSYKSWDMLEDASSNDAQLKEITSSKLVEVFNKENNGTQLKAAEDIDFHLGCCLATVMLKSPDHSVSNREFISVSYVKRFAASHRSTFSDFGLVLKAVREHLKLKDDQQLTIIWRIDEIQLLTSEQEVQEINASPNKTERKHDSLAYKYAQRLMGNVVDVASENNTFIIPIFSGTSGISSDISSVMPSTLYVPLKIPLSTEDLKVEKVVAMLCKETGLNLEKEHDHRWNFFVQYLGPVPRLVQWAAEKLKVDKTANIENVHKHVNEQLNLKYSLFRESSDSFKICLLQLLLATLERSNIFDFPEHLQEMVTTQIVQGNVFLSSMQEIKLPSIFVENILCSLFLYNVDAAKELHNMLTNSIAGNISSSDFEKFPGYFYALKVYLYAKCGIWKTRFSRFFKGMFMHDNLKCQDITFEKSTVEINDFQVQFVYAKGSALKTLSSVDVTGGSCNCTKKYCVIHIGSKDPYHDSVMNFPDMKCLFRIETKLRTSDNGQIALSGISHDSFKHEQEQASLSPVKQTKKNVFIFVTNGNMSERNAENVVKGDSMFVNEQRWDDTFSPVFSWIKLLHETKERKSHEEGSSSNMAFESRENGIDVASSVVVGDVGGGIADDEVHQHQLVVGSLTNNLSLRNTAQHGKRKRKIQPEPQESNEKTKMAKAK